MNSDLRPEVRVDKRGVAVTRHVKQQQSTHSKSVIPSVKPLAAIQQANRGNLTEQIVDKASSLLEGEMGWGTSNPDEVLTESRFREILGTYSDDTISLIARSVGDGKDKVDLEDLMELTHVYSELNVREFMVYGASLKETHSYESAVELITGLHYYPDFADIKDMSLADPNTQESCKALLKIAHIYLNTEGDELRYHEGEESYTNYPTIKSDQLVSLVLDTPDRAESISDYIYRNGPTPVSSLREMVEGTHSATQDGWL